MKVRDFKNVAGKASVRVEKFPGVGVSERASGRCGSSTAGDSGRLMNVSGSSIVATQSSWGPATMTYSLLDQTTSLPSAPKLSHTHTALLPSPSNPQTPCVYPETLRSISQHPGPHNSHKHTDSSCSSPLYITHTHSATPQISHTAWERNVLVCGCTMWLSVW